MPASHRSHRRKKAGNAARLGIAGAVTGVVGVAALAGAIYAIRTHETDGRPDPGTVAAAKTDAAAAGTSHGRTLAKLKAGPKLDLTTPDGYTYAIAAVESGTADKPLPGTRTPPPDGATLAYIDYVITNTGTRPALLDFPADLFVKRSALPASVAGSGRCMPQPGAPSGMCTLPDTTQVIDTLGFPAPRSEDGDQFIPAGASYLLRVATDMGVNKDVRRDDVGLYVWNPRFVTDRQAVEAEFPPANGS
ncbi:hypothetical protein NE235_15580 [Actinoallomurus spadix]|uniref:Uncharacterized protein n=1 Tax=Actinoallomurus spadix TaxID=79912 RepID=A0ABN0VTY5_9ACTN|nr:hypothetical protein [Actinoallomurus spadix]MCO5987520.1 hypothetical protein [Actinoallomurus spadix]